MTARRVNIPTWQTRNQAIAEDLLCSWQYAVLNNGAQLDTDTENALQPMLDYTPSELAEAYDAVLDPNYVADDDADYVTGTEFHATAGNSTELEQYVLELGELVTPDDIESIFATLDCQ
jgi:hypothetical protein